MYIVNCAQYSYIRCPFQFVPCCIFVPTLLRSVSLVGVSCLLMNRFESFSDKNVLSQILI